MAAKKKVADQAEPRESEIAKMIEGIVAKQLAETNPGIAVVIGSVTALANSLTQLQQARDKIERRRITIDDQIGEIAKTHAAEMLPLIAEVNALELAITKYAEYHRDSLLAEYGNGDDTGEGKTAEVVTGKIVFRQKPPTLRKRPNIDENDAAGALKAAGFGAYVVEKSAIMADAVRQKWNEVKEVLQPYYTYKEGGENVLIYPNKTKV
jgi:phage host-nuclease inhibitor protein Gam